MSYGALFEETRSLYEILGISKDANAAEIKKSYRKKALRLHPDKNPSTEAKDEFLKVNAAYEILKNERARQAYDRFGLQMAVLVVDPQAARPDSLSTMLGQLGLLERCSILIVITIVLAMVVVAPIFVSMRWDATIDWDWTAVFVPLWVWEAILLVCCVCCTQDKFFGPEPDDEGLKRELRGTRVGAIFFVYSLLSFAVLQAFLAARLDGTVQWNYWIVLLPWIQWEGVSLLYKLFYAPSEYAEKLVQHMAAPEPERESEVRNRAVAGDLGFYVFTVEYVVWTVARLALGALIAAKWNGDLDASYWGVFSPLWAALGVSLLFTMLRCCGITFGMEPEMPPGTDPEEAASLKFRARIGQGVCMVLCVTVPLAVLITLAAAKSEDNGAFSAIYIFLPFLIYAGCTCLCVGCVFCFTTGASAEYEEQDKPGAESSAYGAAPAAAGESDTPYTRAEEGRPATTTEGAAAPAPAAAAASDEDIHDID